MINFVPRLATFPFFLTLLFSIQSFAQFDLDDDPLTWKVTEQRAGDGKEIEIHFDATLEDGWHVYALDLPEGGPVPTAFEFKKSEKYTLSGKISQGNPIKHYDPNFGMELSYFDKQATFIQKIKPISENDFIIEGTITYMTCDDEKCLPPEDYDFKLVVKAQASEKETQKSTPQTQLSTSSYQAEVKDEIINEKSSKTDEIPNLFGDDSSEKSVLTVEDVVAWNYQAKKINSTTYELIIEADLKDSWHIYSQFIESENVEGSPIATSFLFNPNEGFKLIGKVSETDPIVEYDPFFNMDVKYFENKVEFKQRIQLVDTLLDNIGGSIDFMVCADVCLPPTTEEFTIYLNNNKPAKALGLVDDAGNEFPSGLFPSLPNLEIENPVSYCGMENKVAEEKNRSSISWLLIGVLGGLFALITPCVFPMIPLTVSFFTKMSEGPRRNGVLKATWYGLSIVLIYAAATLPFHLIDGADPEMFNEFATGVGMNIFFFILLLVFAFSFFGFYEIGLPSKWANKVDSASNVGGLFGVFLMGLTLVIVSFTCTGAILGSVLGSVFEKGPWPLTYAFVGFGIGLGAPFALFAMFPSWLKSLPKSGGWLNTVKVTLGFIELALALKFLSNADLVKQWGILPRQLFICIWIIIGLGLVIYLLGKIKFPHDTPNQKISKFRYTTAFLVLAFVIYLIPGGVKSDYEGHKLLSGYLPPKEIHVDFKDFDEAYVHAQKVGKPIFIDFTGHACANCRKMEENVWVVPEIQKLMTEHFVMVSLYVDDKRELAEELKTKIKVKKKDGDYKIKKIKTIGNKWAAFERFFFKNASQPHYALLSPDGRLLTPMVSGMTTADKYQQFLECGLEAMKSIKKR